MILVCSRIFLYIYIYFFYIFYILYMSFLSVYRWIGYIISLSSMAYGGYLHYKEKKGSGMDTKEYL